MTDQILIPKGTGNMASGNIPIEMDKVIHMLDPNADPFIVITNKLGSRTTKSVKPEWQEDDYVGFYGAISGAMAVNETEIVVADPTLFIIGDQICCPNVASYDNMLVRDITIATKTLTVTRQVGGEASAPALPDGTKIARIGSAFMEGSPKAGIISTNPVPLYNYVQIFKKTLGATGTLQAINLYGGNSLAYDRKKAAIEFQIEKEKTMLFGRLGIDNTGKHPLRLMGGLTHFIKTNIVQQGGAALTESDWDDYLDVAYFYGNKTKYTFCSSKVINAINGFAKSRLQTVSKDKTYGIDVTEYISTGKKVYLIEAKRVFDVAPWNKWAMTVDIEKIRQIKLRPTKLETGVQENGADEEQDQLMSEESLEVKNEKCHAILQDVG